MTYVKQARGFCVKLRAVLAILLLNQTIFFDCGKKTSNNGAIRPIRCNKKEEDDEH